VADLGSLSGEIMMNSSNAETALKRIQAATEASLARMNDLGAAGQKAGHTLTEEMTRPIGIIEQLRINMGDLRAAIEQTSDPVALQRLNAELKQTSYLLKTELGNSYGAHRTASREMSYQLNHTMMAFMGLSYAMTLFAAEEDKGTKNSTGLRTALRGAADAGMGVGFMMMMLGPAFASAALPVAGFVAIVAGVAGFFKRASEEANKLREDIATLRKEVEGESLVGLKAQQEALQTEELRINATLQGEDDRRAAWEKTKQEMEKLVEGSSKLNTATATTLMTETEYNKLVKRGLDIKVELKTISDGINTIEEKRSKLINNQNKAIEEGVKDQEKMAAVMLEMNAHTIQEGIDEANKELESRQRLAVFTTKMDMDVLRSAKLGIAEKYTAEELAEIARHEQQISNIKTERDKELEDEELVASDRVRINKLAETAIAAENAGHTRALALIHKTESDRQLQDALRGGMELADALSQAFNETANGFMAKMVIILRIAAQIARMSSLAQGASTGDYLSLAGQFVMLGMAEGGYTGPGSRYQPRGLVHAGEIVFEKPLVEQYGGALMGLRSMLQGYAGGGYTGLMGLGAAQLPSGGGIMMVKGKIDLSNGQLFLRREMQYYDKFRARKIVQ
jgi:hypothetical protein